MDNYIIKLVKDDEHIIDKNLKDEYKKKEETELPENLYWSDSDKDNKEYTIELENLLKNNNIEKENISEIKTLMSVINKDKSIILTINEKKTHQIIGFVISYISILNIRGDYNKFIEISSFFINKKYKEYTYNNVNISCILMKEMFRKCALKFDTVNAVFYNNIFENIEQIVNYCNMEVNTLHKIKLYTAKTLSPRMLTDLRETKEIYKKATYKDTREIIYFINKVNIKNKLAFKHLDIFDERIIKETRNLYFYTHKKNNLITDIFSFKIFDVKENNKKYKLALIWLFISTEIGDEWMMEDCLTIIDNLNLKYFYTSNSSEENIIRKIIYKKNMLDKEILLKKFNFTKIEEKITLYTANFKTETFKTKNSFHLSVKDFL